MSTQPLAVPVSIARGRPGLLFATLLLGQMSQGLVFNAFMAALPQMAHDLGPHGPFIAQMTMALASLGLMCGSLMSGWILEKGGTRVTLLSSLLAFGLAGAGGMFLRNPTLLLASRFLLGFASACMITTCVWGIAAEYVGNRRAKALGISGAVSILGALGSVLLGGYIAKRGGWPLTFVQYPIFALLGYLLAFASIRQVRPDRERTDQLSPGFIKALLPFFLLVMILYAVMFMSSTQLAFMLEEHGIRDPATRSLFMGAVTVIGVLISFSYGALQQRLGIQGTYTLGLACMAVGLTAVGWGASPTYLIVGAGLMGLYVGVIIPYVYHAVSERTDAHSRSRAIGLLTTFGFLGGFLNPIIFAPLSDAIGLRNVFWGVAAFMAVLSFGTAAHLVRSRVALRRRAVPL